MKKPLVGLLLVIPLLVGCGSDAVIAKKVKFRVIFSEKVVQVRFEINPEYQIKIAKTYKFDRLGSTFIKWTNATQPMELGVNISGDRSILNAPRATVPFEEFPNGSSLPGSVPDGTLQKLEQPDNELIADFMFQSDPLLIAGGAFQHTQFNALPKNFLGTQRFFTVNGDVQATISALGPTDNTSGGIYFFGNFGLNPFPSVPSFSQTRFFEPEAAQNPLNDVTWEIAASEPVRIINPGRAFRWFSLPISKDLKFFSDYPEQVLPAP